MKNPVKGDRLLAEKFLDAKCKLPTVLAHPICKLSPSTRWGRENLLGGVAIDTEYQILSRRLLTCHAPAFNGVMNQQEGDFYAEKEMPEEGGRITFTLAPSPPAPPLHKSGRGKLH